MKATFFIVVLTLLAYSCKQAEKTVKSEGLYEEVHRYSTVYEGNRIIKYHKLSEEIVHVENCDYSGITNDEQSGINELTNRYKLLINQDYIDLPQAAARDRHSVSKLKTISEDELMVKEEGDRNESDLGVGFASLIAISISIVLIVLGILTFNVLAFSEILFFIGVGIWLIALVLSIVGIKKNKSKKDRIMSIIAFSAAMAVLLFFLGAFWSYLN